MDSGEELVVECELISRTMNTRRAPTQSTMRMARDRFERPGCWGEPPGPGVFQRDWSLWWQGAHVSSLTTGAAGHAAFPRPCCGPRAGAATRRLVPGTQQRLQCGLDTHISIFEHSRPVYQGLLSLPSEAGLPATGSKVPVSCALRLPARLFATRDGGLQARPSGPM